MTASYSIETWKDENGWHWWIVGETNDYASEVDWSTLNYKTEEEARNKALSMLCGCGELTEHGHYGFPCCGGNICCPFANK